VLAGCFVPARAATLLVRLVARIATA
jgi:hypothetical protein